MVFPTIDEVLQYYDVLYHNETIKSKKIKDIRGRTFGRLCVIDLVKRKIDITKSSYHNNAEWLCRCQCGNYCTVRTCSLKTTNCQSCGCLQRERTSKSNKKELTGKKFGYLTVVNEYGRTSDGHILWECDCICGNTTIVSSKCLLNGEVISCGCYRREQAKQNGESNIIDLSNQRFGKRVVKYQVQKLSTDNESRWFWVCDCGNSGTAIRSSIINSISCGCEKSRGECQIANMLSEHHIPYRTQYTFADLVSKYGGKLRFDFCVFDDNDNIQYLIEYQGEQHYHNVFNLSDESFREALERDELKRQYCISHHIPLIEIRYDEELTLSKILMFKTKNIIDEDFLQYKKPSMFISNTICHGFKCDKENESCLCINSQLVHEPTKMIVVEQIIQRYFANPLTSSVVFGGLENFDEFNQLLNFIKCFRQYSQDDIVIYTGFNFKEIKDKIEQLQKFPNIIVKFGRYKNGDTPHYDPILGVQLASNNQYSRRIS